MLLEEEGGVSDETTGAPEAGTGDNAHAGEGAGPGVEPDEHTTYLLARVSHLLERRLDQALAPAGLTLRQFSALAHIAHRPGVSSSDLARLLLTTPQAVNTLVARLVAAGLVQRAPSRPRQPLVLSLTRAGQEAVYRAEPLASAAEAEALALISAQRLAATRLALRDLLDALSNPG